MKSKKIIFYLFLSFTLISSLNAETVYKWVDEDGQVHYGSKADNKNAKEMKIKDRPIVPEIKFDDDSDEPSKKSLNAKERANKLKRFVKAIDDEKEAKANEKREKKEQKEIRCNASREQLNRAESSQALYDLDEKGNQIFLSKKQYEQAMQQARARVEKWCN